MAGDSKAAAGLAGLRAGIKGLRDAALKNLDSLQATMAEGADAAQHRAVEAVRAVTFLFLCNYSRNTGLQSREIRH
eukprot:SAG31_NODE_1976_length_6750_cov_8.060893_3_plen_76_part_00